MTPPALDVSARVRHVPERSCVGCRAQRPKRLLIRLYAAAAAGTGPEAARVDVDTAGRAPGRGAYLCRTTAANCLEQARRRRALQRALRITTEQVDIDRLAAVIARQPAVDDGREATEVSTSPQ